MRILAVVALLAVCASAAPAGVPPADAPSGGGGSRAEHMQQLKASLLQALSKGAHEVRSMLASAGAMMGDPDGFAVFGQRMMRVEYDNMTAWWCAQASRPADSTICTRRALIQKLKGLSPEAKKVAIKAQPLPHDASTTEGRKAMTDEARRMLNAYCKADAGAGSAICVQTMSVLERGKRMWRHVQQKTGGTPLPLPFGR